ncbi:hypothetical protein KDA11_02900 [Candidatus Saccharibacteria bacterium]|nr:hypothetical protein [Candidatus Saccharibacteria bacterium]
MSYGYPKIDLWIDIDQILPPDTTELCLARFHCPSLTERKIWMAKYDQTFSFQFHNLKFTKVSFNEDQKRSRLTLSWVPNAHTECIFDPGLFVSTETDFDNLYRWGQPNKDNVYTISIKHDELTEHLSPHRDLSEEEQDYNYDLSDGDYDSADQDDSRLTKRRKYYDFSDDNYDSS